MPIWLGCGAFCCPVNDRICGMLNLRPAWLPPDAAHALMERLLDRVEWHVERLRLYGREVEVPRRVAWCGDSGLNYRYTGTDHPCTGWLPELLPLRERLRVEDGIDCNLVLINRYRDGRDYMGWHSDAERGHQPLIASVSLGATRRFLVRPADCAATGPDERTVRKSWSLELQHGSLLLMDGRQPHSLPRTRRPVGQRINLTFRCIKTAP
jgi:alkylated DNA repair dioxygenase AlkB